MKLESSPSLEEYTKGLPSQSQGPFKSRTLAIVFAIIGIAVLVAGLTALLVVLRGNISLLIGHTGVVTGTVVDEAYRPLQADIYVQLTNLHTRSDANGYFEIRSVPAGPQFIVVAYGGRARAFPVTVIGGGSVDVGRLRFTYVAPTR